MSGLQKRYYAKLYRIGKLKKKPYSQVWKYRDDIRKMHKLQEQYLFLVRHKIESAEELVSVLDNLTDKKKEASKEKSKTYKAKERFKDIFDKAEQIRELDDAESCYQSGDTFFEDEHNAWERLNTELLAQGYSVEEVESLRKKYESKYAQDCKAERAVSKELSLGKSIWKELTVSASAEEKQYDKETIRDRKERTAGTLGCFLVVRRHIWKKKREPLSEMAIERKIQILRNKHMDSEVIALVKSDYEYGLTDDEIGLYLNKSYDIEQMKVLSKCLHKGVSEELLTLLKDSRMAAPKMQTALDYYEKGVPIDAIREVVQKDDTAVNMRRMFDVVLEKLNKAKEQMPQDLEYVKSLVAQMDEVVEKINHQNERYDALE